MFSFVMQIFPQECQQTAGGCCHSVSIKQLLLLPRKQLAQILESCTKTISFLDSTFHNIILIFSQYLQHIRSGPAITQSLIIAMSYMFCSNHNVSTQRLDHNCHQIII